MELFNQKGRVPLKNILLATDFSPASEAALPHALKIARQYESKLYIAHVISVDIMYLVAPERTATIREQAQQFAQENMEHFLTVVSQAGVSCQPLVGDGVIWDVLQDMIRENHIDLVVLGTHGRRGLGKLLLGSVAEEVFRFAPCPVLTVGPKIMPMRSRDVELSHILYPAEFFPDASTAAVYAVSLAEEYHTRLTFMKVFEERVSSPELQSAVEEPVRHWMDDHVPVGSDLRKRTCFEPGFGPAAEAILKFAGDHRVNLIVMGVRRLDPTMAAHLPKLDTAYEVVRNAPCPVLTVR
jgi:nucleotide-binding universal stress UspA family protein